MAEVTFRTGSLEDGFTVYVIFERAIGHLERSRSADYPPESEDLAEAERMWPKRKALYDHLTRSAEHFVIAEVDGEPVGYARSIRRDDALELTDFFVLPGRQGAGIGRQLLERAFPVEGARHRTIIATTDTSALVRYLKSGVYARFPIYNFSREPRRLNEPDDLECEPLTGQETQMELLRALDRAVLGYTRDVDHHWWQQDRQGYLYRRAGQVIGYGYTGYDGGPFALLNEADYPAVLRQAETAASGQFERFHLEVPLINRAAVDYLLREGYQMGSFITLLMSDAPFGRFEQYILPAPPFTL